MYVRLKTKEYPDAAGRALVLKELDTLQIGQVFDVVREHEDGAYTLKGLKYSYPDTMFEVVPLPSRNSGPPYAPLKPIGSYERAVELLTDKAKRDIDKVMDEAIHNEVKDQLRTRFIWGFVFGLITAIVIVCAACYFFVPHI